MEEQHIPKTHQNETGQPGTKDGRHQAKNIDFSLWLI